MDKRYWKLIKFLNRYLREHPDEFPPGFVEEYNQDHAPILQVIKEK